MGRNHRYERFLYGTTSDRQPSQVVCLEAAGEDIASPDVPRVRAERCTGWAAVSWRREKTKITRLHEEESSDPAALWKLLRTLLGRGGTTWAFSSPASRTWTLLGLWDLIERGVFQVSGSADPLTDDDGHDYANGRPGYLILEDPPFIVQGRLNGCAGTLRIVCMGNYSLGVERDGKRPLDVARAVSAQVVEMIRVLTEGGLGALQATAGAQAWHAWRRRYLTELVYVHNDERALRVEGNALIGGRCEAFRLGPVNGPVYQLDWRSHYPSLCVGANLPVRLVASGLWPDTPESAGCGPGLLHFAKVRIGTDVPAFPVRREGLVVWPVGTFWTTLAGPELHLALEMGCILDWDEWACYEGGMILDGYMRHLFGLRMAYRQTGERASEKWIKHLLNSLPGKFGQRRRGWQDVEGGVATMPWGVYRETGKDGITRRYRSVAWHLQREMDQGWSPHAVPAVTAWINSLARVKLWQAIQVAGPGNVYYVDTDSLWCGPVGWMRLNAAGMVRDDTLGFLRQVAIHRAVEFLGVKHYVADGVETRAGVGVRESRHRGRPWEQWERQKIADSACRRERPSAAERLVSRPRAAAYRHGVVGPGGEVTPWHISD